MTGRRRCAGLAAAVALLAAAAPGGAQVTPVFTAPLVQPAFPAPPPPVDLSPQQLVRWFEDACVRSGAQPGPAVDWALANGFEPVDPMRGDAGSLLEGEPGSVLAAPGAGGRVLLAAADSRCSLWAEHEEGPPLRQALAAMVGTLTAKGARAEVEVERSLDKAGAWRGQVQWRYRAVGAAEDLGVGAVTTLANGPGTQVLTVSRLAARMRYAPDGQQAR